MPVTYLRRYVGEAERLEKDARRAVEEFLGLEREGE